MAARRKDLSTQLGDRKGEPVVVDARDQLQEVEKALGVVPHTPRLRSQGKKQPQASSPEPDLFLAPQHPIGGITIDDLYKRIQQKRHLSGYSLRFRADELDDLDRVYKEIAERDPDALSKNDIARTALIWLLEDYHAHGDESILGQIAFRD